MRAAPNAWSEIYVTLMFDALTFGQSVGAAVGARSILCVWSLGSRNRSTARVSCTHCPYYVSCGFL